MAKKLDFLKALAGGWNMFRKNTKLFLLMGLIYMAFDIPPNVVPYLFRDTRFVLSGTLMLVYVLTIMTFMSVGIYGICLNLYDGKKAGISTMVAFADRFLRAIAIRVIIGLMIIVVLVPAVAAIGGIGHAYAFIYIFWVLLLAGIILVVYLLLRTMLSMAILLDKDFGVKESLEESFRLTKGRLPGLALLFLIIIVGAGGIGFIVTTPIIYVDGFGSLWRESLKTVESFLKPLTVAVWVHAYRQLREE